MTCLSPLLTEFARFVGFQDGTLAKYRNCMAEITRLKVRFEEKCQFVSSKQPLIFPTVLSALYLSVLA